MWCKNIIASGILVIAFSVATKAQLYTNLGEQHNQFFVGAGYYNSFSNITYGFNHTRYFKVIKRDVTGILDFSSPLAKQYYTRFVFRKGFQIDAYKHNNFKIPVAIVTSSIKKKLAIFSLHDIVTNINILPGIYTTKYSIAGDVSANFLLFRKTHVKNSLIIRERLNPSTKHHRLNVSAGIVAAYNLKHFSFLATLGVQQISLIEIHQQPFYAEGIVAYKLNFKKHKAPEVKL